MTENLPTDARLGLDLEAADAINANASHAAKDGYVVLARKYRPKDFSTLIGQEVLVRTLSNAFAKRRLAHAFLLTGVRGVGKTTTARILAKAFNCTGTDGTVSEPTPQPCGQCASCVAITGDRHVDVLEIDAASNTGVDYIRDLQSELQYKPVQSRFRVYIVDEVHMLSNSAFNAFLKTLEEPPSHVKFIFATTEANKLPITVRSRCQRFDLRRVSAAQLKEYYGQLAALEAVSVDDEALSLISQAADGSVRDGLSMLDQAIALASQEAGGSVSALNVRAMLGLNEGGRLMTLFEHIHRGEIAEALTLFGQMFQDGADPSILARELCTLTHLITRYKIVGEGVAAMKSKAESEFLGRMAQSLGLGALNRSWELLIKGLDELRTTAHPEMSFEMLLVRLCHTAQMPDPDALLQQLQGERAQGSTRMAADGKANVKTDPEPDGETSNAVAEPELDPDPKSEPEPAVKVGTAKATETPAEAAIAAETETQTDASTKESPKPSTGQTRQSPNANAKASAPTPNANAKASAPTASATPSMVVSHLDPNDLDSNFLISDKSAPLPQAHGAAIDAFKPLPDSFEALVVLLEENREGLLATHMSEDVRPVSLEGTRLRLRLTQQAPRDVARTLAATLQRLTGKAWDIGLSDDDGGLSIGDQRRAARTAEYQAVAQHPAVAKTLTTFPDAKIHDIRHKKPDTDVSAASASPSS